MTLPVVFRSAVLLPLLLTGCGDRSDTAPVDTFSTQVEARAGVPFARAGAGVSLVVPASASSGASVPIRLRIANATSAPLTLNLRGPEAIFDITITDEAGNGVWRRLEGAVIPATLQIKTLGPGEVMELSHDWNQKSQRGVLVTPGRYTIRGAMLTDGRGTLESTETLQITPR